MIGETELNMPLMRTYASNSPAKRELSLMASHIDSDWVLRKVDLGVLAPSSGLASTSKKYILVRGIVGLLLREED